MSHAYEKLNAEMQNTVDALRPARRLLSLASPDPDHRAQAERWLEDHPELQVAVDEGLAEE